MTSKFYAQSIAACLFFCGGLFAGEANGKAYSSEKLCAKNECCPEPKSCCVDPCPTQCKDVTPSARGCYCRDGFTVFADFLYWTANEELSIGYAFHYTDTTEEIGSIVNLDTGMDPGFRIGVGGNFGYDGWDLTGAWTYYHNSSADSISVLADSLGLGLSSNFLTSANRSIPTASATWKLNFNAINVDLGRAFYVSKGLSLRPYISSETVWIHRWLAVDYALENSGSPVITNTPGKYRGRNNFWGTGPRVGMDTKWYLGCTGLNLTSNLALSMLYGELKANSMCAQGPNNLVTADFNNNFWNAIPHLQIMLGLGWESCFCSDQYFISFSAGWEFNEFWHLQSFMYPQSAISIVVPISEAVFMQGLTFRTKFDF